MQFTCHSQQHDQKKIYVHQHSTITHNSCSGDVLSHSEHHSKNGYVPLKDQTLSRPIKTRVTAKVSRDPANLPLKIVNKGEIEH